MAKVNTIANNGLTIVENYNKLLEQFRKAKTIDDVRILVASVRDFISVYKRVDKNMVNEIYDKLQSKLQDMVAENAFVYDRMNSRVEEIRNRGYDYVNEKDMFDSLIENKIGVVPSYVFSSDRSIPGKSFRICFSLCLRCLR